MTEAEVQLTVKFVTKLPEAYRIPETPLAVTGSAKRGALSKIVNHVLKLNSPKPFDFVVEGKLLRTALQQHFAQHNLSVEGVIEIEYIPVILPPKTKKTAIHDDWISSISAQTLPVLSASYDGSIKAWSQKLDCLWSFAGHEHPVTSVTHVPNYQMFLTASQDFQIKAWTMEETMPKHCATLSGSKSSVCSVCVSPDGERCCSVGWGEQMHMWPCGATLLTYEPSTIPSTSLSAKRQKTEENRCKDHVCTVSPLGQLEGHQGCVSDVIWPRKHTLFTGGWDHTVRKWDAKTGVATEMLTSHRVVHCLTSPPDGTDVVAFGSSDAILRLWDARERSQNISVKLYRSHSNWISAIAWSPISAFHIATASHDQSVRVWDIRGSVPLVSCSSHSDKCLCVDWGPSEWVLLSGGADCRLHTYDIQTSFS